jgi:ribosomal protein S18 acetylase RimI-like enzyme
VELPTPPVPHALTWATTIDVLPCDRQTVRSDDHWVIRSPGNPSHYWGNLILFDDPPAAGDADRWEHVFAAAFADDPRIGHVTLAWDRTHGELGYAHKAFLDRGYELNVTVALTAPPDGLAPHARASGEVTVRALDPAPGADAEAWAGVLELQLANYPGSEGERQFSQQRLDDLRRLFCAGRGAWYVALADHEVAGSCGIVVTAGRARFQLVDTALAHRRRGVCSRLVVDAAGHAAAHHAVDRFVICADPHYHALGLYQSLGFRRTEHTAGVCRPPQRSSG